MQLVLLLLLWRSLFCVSESTITHASNVSKRQLQYGGGGNFPPPNYQAHGSNQQANHFIQTLYDPGYNAQHLHEVDTAATDNNTTDAAELRAPQNATLPLQQATPANAGLDAPQFEAPQTFSHIYFPHAGAHQHALTRTAAHVFPPGETPAALAARNSGRTYSTSSTYFVPLSVLYHPNADAQQPAQAVYTQRLAQQQQQVPAYPPLPPPPALYQQYAPPTQLSPAAAPSIAAQPTQLAQQSAQITVAQQQSALAQNAYTAPALPRLPHLMPLPLPPSHAHSSSPLPLNFQAPFHPSQFLGYMQERDTRNAMPSTTVSAVVRTPQHTQAYVGYPQQQQQQQQQQVEKPIYEHMSGRMNAKPQNYQTAETQQAHYGRYVYMAPQNGYALFKAA